MPCAVRVTAWGVGRAPDLSEELSVQVQRVACRAQIICCMDAIMHYPGIRAWIRGVRGLLIALAYIVEFLACLAACAGAWARSSPP